MMRPAIIHGLFIAVFVLIVSAAMFVFFNSTNRIPGKIIVPPEEKAALDKMVKEKLDFSKEIDQAKRIFGVTEPPTKATAGTSTEKNTSLSSQ